MNNHLEYISQELPKIEDFIRQETEKLDDLVRPVTEHVLAAGGKRFRPMMTVLYARALGHRGDGVYPMACALEFLHSATLLHDDILDDADLRRGKEAAHVTFSKGEAILAGDVLLALANKLVADYNIPRLVSALSEAVMLTCIGEIKEIAGSRSMDLTREAYMDIITGKTAYLLQAASECGAILAGASEEGIEAAASMGRNLGIAFQLVDDALDYSSPSEVSGKPEGSDLREGKLTLPLLLLLDDRSEEERQALLERIKAHSLSEDEIKAVVQEIRDKDYTGETRREAAKYAEKAREALGRLPDCIEKEILAQSVDYVLSREK